MRLALGRVGHAEVQLFFGARSIGRKESCAALGEVSVSGAPQARGLTAEAKLSCSLPGFILLSGASSGLLCLEGVGQTGEAEGGAQ